MILWSAGDLARGLITRAAGSPRLQFEARSADEIVLVLAPVLVLDGWVRTSKRTKKANDSRKPLVLITGASQGIGAAIAQEFAREFRGVRLALVARNEKNLRVVAKACAQLGAKPEIFLCDVTNEVSVGLMAEAVAAQWGNVDVLVNNAGKFQPGPFLAMRVADFDAQIADNLRSVFLVSRALIPAMVKRGRGDVFNVSSIAGLAAYPGGAAYCAAKFGVTGLTKVMRAELKGKGVRVCAVHPGATWTPSWEGSGFKPERMMPAEDVAQAIVAVHKLGGRTVVEEIVLRPEFGDV